MSADDLDPAALEAARKAVEDVLVDFRDNRISVFGGNGFVIREANGKKSPILRLSTAHGLCIGIKAYLSALREAAVGGVGKGKAQVLNPTQVRDPDGREEP